MTLRIRLLVLIFLLVVPAVGLTVYSAIDRREQSNQAAKQAALGVVERAQADQVRLIQGTHLLLSVLSQIPAVRSANPSGCQFILDDAIRSLPSFAHIQMMTPDGASLCASNGEKAPVPQEYLRHIVENRQFTIGDTARITSNSDGYLLLGQPILDDEGKVGAVIVAAARLVTISHVSSDGGLPPEFAFTIVDQTGTILARQPEPEKWVGQTLPGVPLISSVLAQQTGQIEIEGLDGEVQMHSFSPLSSLQGDRTTYVIASTSLGIENLAADIVLRRNLLGLLIVALLSWIAAIVGAEAFVLRPANALLVAVKRIASGDLSARTGIPPGNDELSQLTQVFDQMAEAIQERESDRQRVEDQMTHQAFHDALTELPNRALFVDRVERALARCERNGTTAAVLFVDIDNLKVVNDSLGHHAGDALLMAVAERLRTCIREADTAARIGGDEFTVLLEEVSGESDAVIVAERFLDRLRSPFIIGAMETYATASIGIALSSRTRNLPDLLLRDADVAMYRAKNSGKSQYRLYEPSMTANAVHQLQLGTDLHKAIDGDLLEATFLPIIDLRTGTVRGAEVLPRWSHPRKGMLTANEIQTLAVDSGLNGHLARWLLEAACRQWRIWHADDLPTHQFLLSVNIGSLAVQDPGLSNELSQVVQKNQMDPACLQLEVTDVASLPDVMASASALGELKSVGVQLAMDIFGAGNSSLAHLTHFPLDSIKVDRSFVENIQHGVAHNALMKAVVQFAHATALKVTADGIKNSEQISLLRDLGCDTGRGPHIASPATAIEFEELWTSGKSWSYKVQKDDGMSVSRDVA